MAVVELRDVHVSTRLRGLSLRVERGEAVCIVGRSGSGKTTLLRTINGVLTPDRGSMLRNGEQLTPENVVELRRRTGTVFQAASLFPHRTVFENVALRLRLNDWDEQRINDEVPRLLSQVGLDPETFAGRFPRALSGGEQQRVGIARALAASPELLLCDEPFSALDVVVRRELQELFVALWREEAVSLLFVTHDVREAMRIGSRIVTLDDGVAVFDGKPEEIVKSEQPAVRLLAEAGGLR